MLVRDAMRTTTVTIDAQESLPQAALTMQTLGVRRLLVLCTGKVVGLITDGEVRRALLHSSQSPMTQPAGTQPQLQLTRQGEHTEQVQKSVSSADGSRVSQIMRQRVFTTRPDEDLRQAVGTLLDRHVGGLPVLDQEGSLVGMLTLTDVLRAAAHLQPGCAPSGGEAADWGTVRRHMSAGAVTVSPETPLAEAAARLTGTRLRVLPVVQEQTLVGVLHQQDIRAAVARQETAHTAVLTSSVTRGTVQSGHGQHGAVLDGTADLKDFLVLQGRKVRELMCPPEAEIPADAPLLEAVQAMLGADVHGLPVVNGDVAGGDPHRFLGVITVSDVLRALLSVTPRRSEHA